MPLKYTLEYLINNPPDRSRLTPLRFDGYYTKPSGKKFKKILCRCSCGKEVSMDIYRFKYGETLSCGCLSVESTKLANTKFYPVIELIYNSWHSMMNRCYRKSNVAYKYYGGAGITVCDEWKNNYQNFLDWSLANGWEEGLHLDKDIKGGKIYSPQTCSWVTREENMKNRSCSIKEFGAYKDGVLIYTFKDIEEAMNTIGGKRCSYTLVFNGTRKTLFGYTLKMTNERKRN